MYRPAAFSEVGGVQSGSPARDSSALKITALFEGRVAANKRGTEAVKRAGDSSCNPNNIGRSALLSKHACVR